jgi:hypothetical protein
MAVEIRIRRPSPIKAGMWAMPCFLKLDMEKK